MAVPSVTCNDDVHTRYDGSTQLISLGASATGTPTSWEWTILAVPEGSVADVGVKGDFTDGVASVQNPDLLIDAEVEGTYVIQCVAANVEGFSDPDADKASGQQLIFVKSEQHLLEVPNDYIWDWGKRILVPTLKSIVNKSGGVNTKYIFDLPTEKYYIDESAGDNGNDGLSWATAKASLGHVWHECIPVKVDKDYIIQWRGLLTASDAPGGWFTGKILGDHGRITLSGEGGGYTVLSTFNLAGTSPNAWEVYHPGAGWTVNEHVGKWMRFNNQWIPWYFVRQVLKNTADRLYFNVALPSTCDSGYSVSFVEPLSTYSGELGFSVLASGISGGIRLNNFKMTSGWLENYGSVPLTVYSVMHTGAGEGFWASGEAGVSVVKFIADTFDPEAGAMRPWNLERPGSSFRGYVGIWDSLVSLDGFLIDGDGLEISRCGIQNLGSFNKGTKSRIACGGGTVFYMYDCTTESPISSLEIDGKGTASDGLIIADSRRVKLGPGFSSSNHTANGVLSVNSTVVLTDDDSGIGAVPTGSGNGVGLKARHSRIRPKSGSAPSLTGSTEIATAAGSSTWAAVEGGTPLLDANEGTYFTKDDTTGY